MDFLVVCPGVYGGGVGVSCEVENQAGFFQAGGDFDCECGSSCGLAFRKDEGAIGVADIPFSTLRILFGRRFLKRIANRDHAIFGQPAFGTPAATGQLEFYCDVERRSVHASLSTRHNLGEDRGHVGQVKSNPSR